MREDDPEPRDWKRDMSRRLVTSVVVPSVLLFAVLGALSFVDDGDSRTRPPVVERPYASHSGVEVAFDVAYPLTVHEPAPAVVLLHGGGWWSGNKEQLSRAGGLAEQVAARGFVAISADYRLACGPPDRPRTLHGDDYTSSNPLCGWHVTDQVEDVQALVRHLRAHARELHLDPDRIGIIGISAGGHLALLAAAGAQGEAEAVQAVVNWSGPPANDFIALQPKLPTPQVRSLRAPFTNAVGCELADCPGQWRAASPIDQLDVGTPRFAVLGIGGVAESQVPLPQLRRFHDRLDQLGITHELATGQGDCHGLSCGMRQLEDSDQSGFARSLDFLREQLDVEASPG